MTLEEKLRHVHRLAVDAQLHHRGILQPKDVAYLIELLASALLEHAPPRPSSVEQDK